MTTEDRHVAKRGGPYGNTCTRCGEPIDADIHVVNPTLHHTPHWLLTVYAPQGGPVYTYTSDGGDINTMLHNQIEGLDLSDADAVLIVASRHDRDTFPLPDIAAHRLLQALEETGLSAAPAIVRKFADGPRRIFEDGLIEAAKQALTVVLR